MRYKRLLIAFAAFFALASCSEKFDTPAPEAPVVLNPNTTIAALKALYTGGPFEIRDDIIIGGTVVSTDEFGNFYRSFYIQDNTGGIEVKIGKTSLYNLYSQGSTVYVKARHLFLGAYGGMVQLGERSTDSKYETSYIDTDLRIKETIFRGAKGSVPAPIEITTSSEVNDNILGMLVTLKNVKYTRQNMTTWAKKATAESDAVYGEHTFQLPGNRNIVVRTSGYSKFASEPVPPLYSYADITGVLTKYGSTYQLVLNSLDGVVVK